MINTENMIMKRFPFFVCLMLLLLLVLTGIPVAAATITVSSISPSSGTYGSSITMQIKGTGLDTVTRVMLYRCPSRYSSTGVIYGSYSIKDPQTITATFQLSGSQVVGDKWDIVVNSPTESGYILEGFTIKGAPTSGTTTTTTKTPTATTTTWTPATTTTTKTTTTTATATTTQRGNNCVVFETNPSEAKISLTGSLIGTTPFTYCTDKDGTFTVVARKSGYEDYEDRVTIREGQRVRFYALLKPLSSATTATPTATTTTLTGSASVDPTTAASDKPISTVTTPRKSSVKIPTPLGTDPPVAEEAPSDPTLALVAAGAAIGLVLIRRR